MKKLAPLLALAWLTTLAFLIYHLAFTEPEVITRTETVTLEPTGNSKSISEPSLLVLINKVRADNNVAPLVAYDGLTTSAGLKADDIVQRDYWSHNTPEGQSFSVLLWQYSPEFEWVGENLAECYNNNASTVRAWKNSPAHMKNMIDPKFSHFGTASRWDETDKCTIYVNHFGG